MKTVVLACETIAAEVMKAAGETKTTFPIFWVESGLHNTPERLKKQLQSDLDRIDNVDYILLLLGYCGNAILNLVSRKSKLVIPKVDDCISMLLGGNEKRNALNKEAMAYYLTEGWLQHDNNLWAEYQHCLKKYGLERTRRLYQIMLGRYKNLNVIDTGAYDLKAFLPLSSLIAAELNLTHQVVKGTLSIIKKALLGQWDEDFAIIECGEPVTLLNMGLGNNYAAPDQLQMGNLGF